MYPMKKKALSSIIAAVAVSALGAATVIADSEDGGDPDRHGSQDAKYRSVLVEHGYHSAVASGGVTIVFEHGMQFPPLGSTGAARLEAVDAMLASDGCTELSNDELGLPSEAGPFVDCSEAWD